MTTEEQAGEWLEEQIHQATEIRTIEVEWSNAPSGIVGDPGIFNCVVKHGRGGVCGTGSSPMSAAKSAYSLLMSNLNLWKSQDVSDTVSALHGAGILPLM